MAFSGFKRATRESVGLLVGLAGPSGSGKSYSAMRLAAGIAAGKPFAVIDTEAGRAKHYADQFVFDHADLRPPFRPSAYAEAIAAADEAGYPVIVVDSMSHEHAGEGGLLDWHEEELDRIAGNDYAKRERVKMTAWIKPKSEHKRMVSRLLQVRAHLILCFRAEQKTDIVKDPSNPKKTIIVPKKTLSGFVDWIPVCEKNLPFELTASFVLSPERPGHPIPIKLQEQHRALFPADQPIDENAGRRIAEWAQGGGPEPRITEAQVTAFRLAAGTRAKELGMQPAALGLRVLAGFKVSNTQELPAAKFDEALTAVRAYVVNSGSGGVVTPSPSSPEAGREPLPDSAPFDPETESCPECGANPQELRAMGHHATAAGDCSLSPITPDMTRPYTPPKSTKAAR